MLNNNIKIKKEDWEYLHAALVTFSLEHFQSHALQDKVKELLKKYR